MDNSQNSNPSDSPGSTPPTSTSDLWTTPQSDLSADANFSTMPVSDTAPSDPWFTPAVPQQKTADDPLSVSPSGAVADSQAGLGPMLNPNPFPQTGSFTNSTSSITDLPPINQTPATEPTEITSKPTAVFPEPPIPTEGMLNIPASPQNQNDQISAGQIVDNQKTTLTPLDNPLGAPLQVPPLDQTQPTPQAAQPSWSGLPTEIPSNTPQNISTPEPTDQDKSVPATPAESAPTDLSHLISSNQSESAASAPETLFVPSNVPQTPEVPNLPTENHKSIPKWLLGVGAFLLIAVIGASAYFILGVGSKSETTSLPATTTTETSQPKMPTTSTPPAAQSLEETSGNFGELQGSGAQNTQGATSAAEILRQRQQQQAQTP